MERVYPAHLLGTRASRPLGLARQETAGGTPAFPGLPQPPRHDALLARVVAELRVGAFGARHLQLRGRDLIERNLQFARLVRELVRAVAQRDELLDLTFQQLRAIAQ